MELKDTVKLMLSDDWRDRLKAEHLEKSKIKQYIKDFCEGLISDDRQFDPVDDAILLCQMIDFAPAADVVEVIRCGKCRYYNRRWGCRKLEINVSADNYCFMAEKAISDSKEILPDEE